MSQDVPIGTTQVSLAQLNERSREIFRQVVESYLATGETPPFSAWAAAGGAGVWVRGAPAEQVAEWQQRCELRLWSSCVRATR